MYLTGFCLLLFLSFNLSVAQNDSDIFEWKVNIGDSQTFRYSKYYDYEDFDGNGDYYSNTVPLYDVNGYRFNVTKQVGSTITIKIIGFESHLALLNVTYNNELTVQQKTIECDTGNFHMSWAPVLKTTTNRTYWEESAGSIEDSFGGNNWTINTLLEGNIVIYSMNTTFEETGIAYELKSKSYWKTGWAFYFYEKESNSTFTFSEFEFSTSSKLVPGFENLPYLGFILLVGVITRRKIMISENPPLG